MLTVINDVHIGTLRSAGTTPLSAWKLRQKLLEGYEDLLRAADTDVLINGDLFDKSNIPLIDLMRCTAITQNWLVRGRKLYLSPGNHCLSNNSSNLSSFEFMGAVLSQMFPEQVTYIKGLTEIQPGYFVLPHLHNQDLLDQELAKVPECQVLFVHTNYDNNFAQESDHSLNISKAQAEACKAKYIVFGHEHQTKTALGGKVVIPGNQVPSSIADCLGCKDDTKFITTVVDGVPTLQPYAKLNFAECDWRTLKETNPTSDFIRVTGTATADEGAAVAQTISRFRGGSDALVISNAVRMQAGEEDLAKFEASLENIQSFDVKAALLELLNAEEAKAVEELLNAQ